MEKTQVSERKWRNKKHNAKQSAALAATIDGALHNIVGSKMCFFRLSTPLYPLCGSCVIICYVLCRVLCVCVVFDVWNFWIARCAKRFTSNNWIASELVLIASDTIAAATATTETEMNTNTAWMNHAPVTNVQCRYVYLYRDIDVGRNSQKAKSQTSILRGYWQSRNRFHFVRIRFLFFLSFLVCEMGYAETSMQHTFQRIVLFVNF